MSQVVGGLVGGVADRDGGGVFVVGVDGDSGGSWLSGERSMPRVQQVGECWWAAADGGEDPESVQAEVEDGIAGRGRRGQASLRARRSTRMGFAAEAC